MYRSLLPYSFVSILILTLAFISCKPSAPNILFQSNATPTMVGTSNALSSSIQSLETNCLEEGMEDLNNKEDISRRISQAWLEDDFSRIIELSMLDSFATTDSSDILLAKAFSQYPKQVLSFPESSVQMDLLLSYGRCPIVETQINGKTFRFWLDSGAGVNVISSKVAEAAGVPFDEKNRIAISSSIPKKVSGSACNIETLSLGEITCSNVPALVFDKKDLTFRLLGIKLMQIDGIIGWPLLKKLDMQLDFNQEKVTFTQPSSKPQKAYSLGWQGQPFIQLLGKNGESLNMKIDLGSSTTFFYPSSLDKTGSTPSREGKIIRAGAGGKAIVPYQQLDSLELSLGPHSFIIGYSEVYPNPEAENECIIFDGVIGQDILSQGMVRLDFENRQFDFSPMEELD